IELERWSAVVRDGKPAPLISVPGWDVLRRLGGEIAEVSALAASEEPASDEPLLVAGCFEKGGLFRALFLPSQPEPRGRLVIVGSQGRAELTFAQSWTGPARLSWRDVTGELHEETWDAWDPWPAVIEVFEEAVGKTESAAVGWQHAIRSLE